MKHLEIYKMNDAPFVLLSISQNGSITMFNGKPVFLIAGVILIIIGLFLLYLGLPIKKVWYV